jgi:hypothetical protein
MREMEEVLDMEVLTYENPIQCKVTSCVLVVKYQSFERICFLHIPEGVIFLHIIMKLPVSNV